MIEDKKTVKVAFILDILYLHRNSKPSAKVGSDCSSEGSF